ncbi:MAG: ARPP-1 family domain-containing protein [Acidobacteriota bacterium]
MDTHRLLNSVTSGRPFRAGQLSVIPLKAPRVWADPLSLLTLESSRASLRVTERADQARVDEVQVYNGTHRPVLLLEGELLRGGYQDRLVLSSVVVGERSAGIVATACSEEGRCEGADVQFDVSGLVASPRYRRQLRLGLYRERSGDDQPDPRQQALWDEIEMDRRTLHLPGRGISLLRLREATARTCRELARRFPATRRESGWLVFVNSRFVCGDLFFSPDLAARYRFSLMEAAAYDSVVEGIRSGPVAMGLPHSEEVGAAAWWTSLRDEIGNALVLRRETCTGSVHDCFESPALAGTLLAWDSRPLHMSIQPALYAEGFNLAP